LGQYYFKLKNYSAAGKYLKRAIQIDDCSVMAHFHLARIYQKDGRWEEAEAEKRKVFLRDPHFPPW
jgi:Tfp pilus assembly protein PilF